MRVSCLFAYWFFVVVFPVNISFTQLGLGIKPDRHLKTLAGLVFFFSCFIATVFKH